MKPELGRRRPHVLVSFVRTRRVRYSIMTPAIEPPAVPSEPSPFEDAIASLPARSADPLRSHVQEALRELSRIDHAVYEAIASTPSPRLDEPLRRLSNAANRSLVWLALAARPRRVRRAAGSTSRRRGTQRGRDLVGAREPGPEDHVCAKASRQDRRGRRRSPAREDAFLNVLSLGALRVGIRLRDRRGPRPSVPRIPLEGVGGGGRVLAGALRRSLPCGRARGLPGRRCGRVGRGRRG